MDVAAAGSGTEEGLAFEFGVVGGGQIGGATEQQRQLGGQSVQGVAARFAGR